MTNQEALETIDKAISELNMAKIAIESGNFENAGGDLSEAHSDIEEVMDEHEKIRFAVYGDIEDV